LQAKGANCKEILSLWPPSVEKSRNGLESHFHVTQVDCSRSKSPVNGWPEVQADLLESIDERARWPMK
jgi:hypothetical protein